MSIHSPSLPMSHIISPDAPLLSPVSSMSDSHWDIHHSLCSPTTDSFNYNYYNLPPSPPNSVGSTSSPIPTARMLKMRMTPESASDSEQLCLPTHQVFDFPEVAHLPTPPSPASSSPKPQRPIISINPTASASAPSKRSASPSPSAVSSKKPRAAGERINSKDFIPPDVSGLSKREARLVKNRAAAFLSRQRKREEFECMEIRVAELEQENARLLSIAQSGNSGTKIHSTTTSSEPELASEIQILRAQLAAAKERELELNAELAAKSAARETPIKVESQEPQFPMSRTATISSPHKSAASLGLMVLLCALPTLLSMPTHTALPTSFTLPATLPTSSSGFDFNTFLPSDVDWSRSGASMMDLDSDEQTSGTSTRRLQFTDLDSSALGGLSGLDISFDTTPSENGKIRVRIHPTSSASSRESSPSAAVTKPDLTSSSSSLEMWAGSDAGSAFESSISSGPYGQSSSGSPYSSTLGGDPFLGIGGSSDFGLPFPSSGASTMMYSQINDLSTSMEYPHSPSSSFGYGSDYSVGDGASGNKRRVRIALKSMPVSGGEGGEWEVQFC